MVTHSSPVSVEIPTPGVLRLAERIMTYLAARADANSQVVSSQKAMVRELHCSELTANKAIRYLKACKRLDVTTTIIPRKGSRTVYTLLLLGA